MEHLEKKLVEELETIQQRLKAEKTRVALKRKGDTLVLVATLPLKPDDTYSKGLDNKQYQLTVNGKGFPFNLDGINEAYLEAKQLGKLVATRTFTWSEKYFKKKVEEAEKPKTIEEMLNEFEGLYFLTRKRNRQSLGTFHRWETILNKCFLKDAKDAILTNPMIELVIKKTDSGTASRLMTVRALSVFCNIFKIEFDFKDYKDGYVPKARIIPTDSEIIQFYGLFSSNSSKKHRKDFQGESFDWMYGILATYGIRPHELFAIDFEKFCDVDNTLNALFLNEKITDGLKTGDRVIFPLHPDWVQLFNLKDIKPLKTQGKLGSLVSSISMKFKQVGIFLPYNLRHAYAIRGHVLGIPLKEMADNMGHSVDMHTKIYQKYMSLNIRKQMYLDAMDRREIKKTEVELLKENELLKEENERLKAQLANPIIKNEQLDSTYHK